MSTLVRGGSDSHARLHRSYFAWGAIFPIVLGVFLLAPGSIEQKAHLALHGVCAQRPSHSLQLGGATLPLDARMTGIYLGSATVAVWLAATRRLRAQARPSTPVLAIIAGFVLLMAADGFNGLLFDLGKASLYQPANVLRLATGILAGIALGVAFGHFVAITIWRSGISDKAVVTRPLELAVPTGLASVLGALILTGQPALFAPFAIGIVLVVLAVFAALLLVVIALASGSAWRVDGNRQLVGMAMTSLILAILIVGVLSGMRLIAEQAYGLPQLT